jgi:hypothetical protein
VACFRDLFTSWQAHGHSETEIFSECLPDLSEAVDLYRGDFLRALAYGTAPISTIGNSFKGRVHTRNWP